ncbi:MAG: ATP-binding protein [Ardenticatenales bacterium]|nr:ATP-binding protein [Ardenticatenales bacterium]
MERLVLEQGTMVELRAIAAFVDQCCAPWVVDSRTLYHLKLAVDEACSNIFEHAYAGQPGRLEIEIERSEAWLTLRLRDWGQPFDPDDLEEPDASLPLEQRRVGGLGVHLIRQVMDRVLYRFDTTLGNCLTLQKKL